MTVFLVNPASGVGHLDMYCRLYSQAFIELGWNVVLISPTDGGTSEYIYSMNYSAKKFKFFSTIEYIEKNDKSIYQKIKQWRATNKAHLKYKNYAQFAIYILVSIFFKIIKYSRKLTNKLKTLYNDYFTCKKWFYFKNFNLCISHLINNQSINPNLIFIMYLDGLNSSRANLSKISAFRKTPWSGILFSPQYNNNSKHYEKYFSLPNCRGALFLTDKHIATYSTVFPSLNFHSSPDITDATLPENTNHIPSVRKVLKFSNQRKIVTLLGSLSPHKGVIDFIKLSYQADPKRFCFVMAGMLILEKFSEEEQSIITKAISSNKNLLAHTDFIKDEAEYNALFNNSDIIYAVYNNFDSSSNTLTKAAFFDKPILADANSTVGERVEKYKLGVTVASNDTNSILVGLEMISTKPINSYNFVKYRSEHSMDKLKVTLRKATDSWLSC